MFKPRFVNPILQGIKTSTIRPEPKRPVMHGTRLSLRTWTSKPYRSKHQFIADKILISSNSIIVHRNMVTIGNSDLGKSDIAALAIHEGFRDTEEFFFWFEHYNDLPLFGRIYFWR